jgi:hypothetical protein
MGSNFFDFGIAGPFEGGSGGGAGAGIGAFFQKLFGGIKENPDLFAQYLSGAGAGLNEGGLAGMTNNMNAITQNTIATKHYANLLQKVLGGDMSGGAKVSMDENGLSIKVPGAAANANDATGGTPQGQGKKFLGDFSSPFQSGLPNFSASDLAGLTPEMLGQVINLKMAKEQMTADAYDKEVKRQMDMMDQQFKAANLEVMKNYYEGIMENQRVDNEQAAKDSARKWIELLTKDERTELQKNYEYAKEEGFKGTLADFKVEGGTPTALKEYEYAKKEGFKGNFIDFIKTQHPATNINLGPYATAIERGKAESINDVLSPDFEAKVEKGAVDEVDKHPDQIKTLVAKGAAKNQTEARSMLETHYKNKAIEDALIQSYGNIGKQVTRGKEGWEVDGKVVRRYAK